MTTSVINVSVANIYAVNTYRSEVVTQAILGERVKIMERKPQFSLVELPDTYTGWISNYQLVEEVIGISGEPVIIRQHWICIYRDSKTDSPVIRDAVIGTRLMRTKTENSWLRVILPDGEFGWIHESATGSFPANGREGITALACEFLGYPYFWGGRSPKGFDCSGLTQTVFGLMGIKIPRDSWKQQQAGKFITNEPANARPGDLYFFAEGNGRITHVGIAMGNGRILHARGYVRENSLIKGETDYSDELKSTFIDVRSFI